MKFNGKIYSCKENSKKDIESYADYYEYTNIKQITDEDDLDKEYEEFVEFYKRFGFYNNSKKIFTFIPEIIDDVIDEFNIDDFAEYFFILPNGVVEPAYDFLCNRAEETVNYKFELKEIYKILL